MRHGATDSLEALLTADEAAEIIGVTRAAVYFAAKDGRLPSERILKRLAFRREDVENYKATAGQRNGYVRRKSAKGEPSA